MFQSVFDNQYLTILQSCVKKPLVLWDKKVRNGYIKRVTDSELQALVLEIAGGRVSGTYITCPGDFRKTLGVRHPNLVIVAKNLKKFFAFDVQILDDNHVRRRFRLSTLTLSPEIKAFCCRIPLSLEDGWNQIVFPMQEFTKRIYNTNYVETLRVQIYPNCRIRRVFFTNKVFTKEEFLETDLPQIYILEMCRDFPKRHLVSGE